MSIGDALVKLKHPFGGFLDGIRMFSPGSQTRVMGHAVTMQMVELSDTSAPKLDQHFVDHNEDGGINEHKEMGFPGHLYSWLKHIHQSIQGQYSTTIQRRLVDQPRGSWFEWHQHMASLAQDGYFCIAPDLKGYGQSSKEPGDYQHEGAAEQLAAMLLKISIEKF
ncbi:hypothetical protein QQX98_004181 [Neonectria punicea]|uniref:AB hydrolase-1 domain-containing protein n=1 Tax=Neonectria punicea TaxID=979145 RepID=A0ABR1HAT9_9HYPO